MDSWEQAVLKGRIARAGKEGWKGWLRQLSQEDITSLMVYARAAIEMMDNALEILQGGDKESQKWQKRVLAVLHLRDDMEGVLTLLYQRNEYPPQELALLDDKGTEFMAQLPKLPLIINDERLKLAGLLTPDVWWAWGIEEEKEIA